MNHNVHECYLKHDFPSWMKQKYKSNVNQIEAQHNSPRNMEEEQTNNV